MEKSVSPMLEAAILFSFRREMGQITLRKSTTGTVVNHKEESSLRGEEFVIGGKGRIPTAAAEAGSEEWTCPNVWRFPVRACPRPPAHLYCHLETNEGVHQAALALAGQSIGRWWWRNDCCPYWRKRVHLLNCQIRNYIFQLREYMIPSLR